MKKFAVALFSLALLGSCSVQTDSQVSADGTAASVAAPAGGGACCSGTDTAKAEGGSCCGSADQAKADTKGACCGEACAPEASAKQP